ncbi:MAG TPA: CHASE2 domain-containing protein [Dissulfurispiraceae bacterium]
MSAREGKFLQGLLIGTIAAVAAILMGFFGFSRKLELMTLDLRYRVRPQIETLPEVGFIDFDDSSLELFGEWPWPRFRHVALVETLNRYKARMAGYDVYFVEHEDTIFHAGRLKRSLRPGPAAHYKQGTVRDVIDDSFRNYDGEFSYAMEEAGNVYLSYSTSDPDEKVAARGAEGVREDTLERRKRFSPLKKAAVEELEKTFTPLQGKEGGYLYKVVDIDPPLPDFIRTARGVGFAQPGVDEDSVRRNYILARSYNGQVIYPVAIKMLSDLMDFNPGAIKFYPGKYALIEKALDYRTNQRKDIRIPIDDHGQMLLNWAGPFDKTYLHVPFRLISYYYAYSTAKEIARKYENAGEADFPVMRDHIFERIMEQEMVTAAEAAGISKEIAASQIAMRLLDKGVSKEEIYGKLERSAGREVTQHVLPVVLACRDMEKALSAESSLTFDKFSAAHPAETGVTAGHLKEAFRNMKFFSGNGDLKDARPYYFPAPRRVLVNGRQAVFSPVDLQGKIFMIGLTGTNTIDLNPSPFEENCPLVAYHVNAINTILSGNFLHYTPWYYKYVAVILLSAVIGVIGTSFGIAASLSLASLLAGGYLFATYKAWEAGGYWLDWVVPVTGMVFAYVTVVVMKFVKEFRAKRQVRGIFSAMVSPAVLKVMEENPDKFSLTGERKPVTTFFSLVDGMAHITKTVAPDELTNLLGIYLTPGSEIIMDYDGYIDKYEGHVIMADFGVPLDDEGNPWKCAFAAIEQRMDIEAFRYFVRARYGQEVNVSMGFNYGYVSAGNMGSERKFQYTVMGDPVNVAARFMASNYIYRSKYAITGEDTVPVVSEYVHLCPLDKLLLKGKTKPTAIYSVLGWKPDAYLKARGARPVPDFLYSLWTKCPPEKIAGYHGMWKELAKRTGHPLAGEIRDFFGSFADLELITSGNHEKYKKAVGEFHKSLKRKRQAYHEMMSLAGSPTKEELLLKQYFEEGLVLYWGRQWDAALGRFRDILELPVEEGPASSLIERIESYKLNPPGEGWQGEFVQTRK